MIIVSCYTELNSAMNDEYNDSNMNISEIEEENSCIDNKFRTVRDGISHTRRISSVIV